MLDQPIKVNRTTAFYTQRHLEQLNLIRELREEKNLSLASIKESMQSAFQVSAAEEPEEVDPSQIIRKQIIDLSVEVFRKKGYERVTITDITEAADISRNTFYQFFKTKKELFTHASRSCFLSGDRRRRTRRLPSTR